MQDMNFQFYNPNLPVQITYRHLPHWHQDNVCAFVTMRLNDSIPRQVKTEIDKRRQHWFRLKGFDLEIPSDELFSCLTDVEKLRFQRFVSSIYQRALDKGSGECIFRNLLCRDLLLNVIKSGHQVYFLLGDAVIMPNHVHLLIQPLQGYALSKILSSIRRMSAREINRILKRKGSLWQPEPFDHLVRSQFQFEKFRKYIALNPNRAKLPASAYTHYLYE